jgi:D-amino-acid dehydrogenase
MFESRHDVLIVGGGVIGLACAYALLRSGRQVTIVEKGRIAGATSHGNCGTITPSHAAPLAMPGLPLKVLRWMLRDDAPFYVKPRWDPALFAWLLRALRRCNRDDFERTAAIKGELLLASRQMIEQWIVREGMDCGFETAGTLYVFRDPAAFEAFAWHETLLTRLGMAVERKDRAQLAAMEPALGDGVVAGYFQPQDAHLRPDRYAAELARVVRAMGATIIEDCEITGWLRSGEAITGVMAADAPLHALDVLLAAGSWSPALACELGMRLPVQPGKGYSITYDRPAIAPRIPLVLKERSICVTAWADGYRLGSTMEFAGYDESLNRVRLDALRRGAADYLREPEGPGVREEWYGWRPMTPDDLPLVGPVAGRKGLWLATGHGMLGVSMSAVTGELIAAQMTGRDSTINPRPFLPDRYVR